MSRYILFVMRMCCHVILLSLHYHDSSSSNPHSAYTDCSVEFLSDNTTHPIVLACKFCLVIVYLLKNFEYIFCFHSHFPLLSTLSIPPSIISSFHPLLLHSNAGGYMCSSILYIASPEMDLACLAPYNKVCASVLSLV